MSKQSRRVHLRKPGGTRAVCRYASRPSHPIQGLELLAFKEVPIEMRCAECHRFWEALRSRSADTMDIKAPHE